MKYTSSYDIVKDIIEKLGGDSTIKFSSVYQQAKYIAEMYGADPNRNWSSTFQILLYIYHNFTPPTPTVKYTITFDIGDATGIAPDTIIAEEGEAIILPYGEGFYKEGYNFTGWRHGEIYYQPGDVFYATEDYDFVAEFELAWNYNGLTFIALEDGAIAMNNFGSNTGSTKPNMEYTLDSVNWNSWDGSEITVSEGQKVGFRGTNTQIGRSTSAYSRFAGSGRFDLQGDIMGLLDGGECTATTLTTTYTFFRLFSANTSIINAKDLILTATVTKGSAYYGMFSSCHNLVSAPLIFAQNIGTQEFRDMFSNCENLIEVQDEFYVLSNNSTAFQYMYQNCTKLEKVPDMLFKNMASNSLNYAFSLSQPGTSSINHIKCLIEGGDINYSYMTRFAPANGTFVQSTKALWRTGENGIPTGWNIECVGETYVTATKFSATTPNEVTFSLYVQSDHDNTWDLTAPDWVTVNSASKYTDKQELIVTVQDNFGGARNGNIIITATDKTFTIPITQVAYEEPNWDDALIFTALEDGSAIALNNFGTNAGASSISGTNLTTTQPYIMYKKNDGDVVDWDFTEIQLEAGDAVKMVAYRIGNSAANYSSFVTSGNIKLSGDLIAMDGVSGTKANADAYAFYKLFAGCTSISSIGELEINFTRSYDSGFKGLFSGCTGFSDTIVKLPIKDLRGIVMNTGHIYANMFEGCTSMLSMPDLSSVTNYGNTNFQNLDGMFKKCTSITKAVLPAKIVLSNNNGFNQTFALSTGLVEAEIDVTSQNQEYPMTNTFSGCTNLEHIALPYLTYNRPTNLGSNWVYGVAPTGSFVININYPKEVKYDTNNVPVGWTIVYYDETDNTYWLDKERVALCDEYGNPIPM